MAWYIWLIAILWAVYITLLLLTIIKNQFAINENLINLMGETEEFWEDFKKFKKKEGESRQEKE